MERRIVQRGGRRAQILWNLFNLALLAILVGLLTYAWSKIHLRVHFFSLTDADIAQPFFSDTVPYYAVPLVGVIVPLIVFFCYALYESCSNNNYTTNLLCAYYWAYGLCISLVVTAILTELIKELAQKFRPDWLHRCFPDFPSAALFTQATATGYLMQSNQCTQTNHSILSDGQKSFLSGHSSSAWATAFYLSLFFYRYHFQSVHHLVSSLHTQQTHRLIRQLVYKKKFDGELVLVENHTTTSQTWKFVLLFAPVLWAFFVAISRLYDNRHHIVDVMLGSLLGIVIAWSVYKCLDSHYLQWDELGLSGKSLTEQYERVRVEESSSNGSQVNVVPVAVAVSEQATSPKHETATSAAAAAPSHGITLTVGQAEAQLQPGGNVDSTQAITTNQPDKYQYKPLSGGNTL